MADIDLQTIDKEVKEALTNISDNLGVPRNKFVTELFTDLLKKTPESEKKTAFKTREKDRLKITNLTDQEKKELEIISENKGMRFSSFVRSHIYTAVANFPDHYKKPKPKF